MKKKMAKPTLPQKSLIKLALATYGKRYFSKEIHLIEEGTLRKIRPPYILLATHASFADVASIVKMLAPDYAGCFIASDTQFAGKGWILRRVGVMPKKQFAVDASLIRDIKYVLDKGYPLIMYPEAKLSVVGTANIIKPAVAKLARLLRVPVVTVRFDGSYLHHPRWAKSSRFVPVRATVKVAVTAEECRTVSVEEIHRRIVENLSYDDYEYQLNNDISVTADDLAEGLHTILYQCPKCGRQHTVYSEGNKLLCDCGMTCTMDDKGRLHGPFEKVTDWYNWQRSNLKKEIDDGKYFVSVKCRAEQQHNRHRFRSVGEAVFTHSVKGIEVSFDSGREGLFYPVTQFYTLSFNSNYIYLPDKTGVYRFRFDDDRGITAKINSAVEILGNKEEI